MCIYFYIISYCSCPHDVNLPHQTPAALRPCLPPSQEAGWVCRLTGGDDADGLDLASAAVAVSRSKDGL